MSTTEQEIMQNVIDSCCGFGKNPKTFVSCTIEQWIFDHEKEESTVKNLSHNMTSKSYVEIYSVNDKYWMLDLSFLSDRDMDLKMIWKSLNSVKEKNRGLKENEMILSRFILLPSDFEGYYIDLINPLFFALQPNIVNGPINTIRLVFEAENVNFIYTDEINKEMIEQEIIEEEKLEELDEMENEQEQREQEIMEHVEKAKQNTGLDYSENNRVRVIE